MAVTVSYFYDRNLLDSSRKVPNLDLAANRTPARATRGNRAGKGLNQRFKLLPTVFACKTNVDESHALSPLPTVQPRCPIQPYRTS
jgi:hypothetical protein